MDSSLLAANGYFVHLGAYSTPTLYNTSLLTSPPSVSDYCPTAVVEQKPEVPDVYNDVTSSSNSSSPPEPQLPIEITAKTDLRKCRRKGKGTNLYGRPYCPGRPLSMEERTQIIDLHMNGMKVNAISKCLCISHGCVSKIISRYRSTGILTPASSPEQRRTRKAKKTDSSPEALLVPEHYPHIEYAVPIPVNFLPSPPELLQPSPNNHFQALPPGYAVLHDPMLLQEYHPHLLL